MNSSPTLQLQSIVYENSQDAIERLISSLKQSYINAKKANVVSKVTYKIGDCSPKPFIENGEAWANKLSDENISIEYIYFNENLGHGGGQNRLGLGSDADILGIINPDVVASPNLIANLVSELLDDNVAIAEAAQVPMEHPKDYDRNTLETTFASGCCMFIKQEIFEQINGFDDINFFMYCDDVDLSWRVRLLGKKIHFVPLATVYHDHRIDESSNLVVGHAEFYYSALGGLLLSIKWGNQKRTEQIVNSLKTDSSYSEVYSEYSAMVDNGKLPQAIVGSDKVAIFTPTGFADYRWTN